MHIYILSTLQYAMLLHAQARTCGHPCAPMPARAWTTWTHHALNTHGGCAHVRASGYAGLCTDVHMDACNIHSMHMDVDAVPIQCVFAH